MLGGNELSGILSVVAMTDHEVNRMGAAYKLWRDDMAASEKYKDVKPDWVCIDDAAEAEKVCVAFAFLTIFPCLALSLHRLALRRTIHTLLVA